MNEKYKFTVKVTGGTKKKEPPKPVEVKHQTISVNMNSGKASKAVVTQSEEQKNTIKLFKDLRKMLNSVGSASVAKNILLEIKKNFADSINGMTMDVEANKYLDDILFDSMENLICGYLMNNNYDQDRDTIKNILIQSINNTVRLLDYEDAFEHAKMEWVIDSFIEVFK